MVDPQILNLSKTPIGRVIANYLVQSRSKSQWLRHDVKARQMTLQNPPKIYLLLMVSPILFADNLFLV